MSTTAEGQVKNRIRALLKKHHAWYCTPSTHGYGRSGIPDFIVAHRGTFIGIEAKTRGKEPTKLQRRELDGILKTGSWAIVVDEDKLDWLDGLLDEITQAANRRKAKFNQVHEALMQQANGSADANGSDNTAPE
jgi:hypothetical protein